MKNTRNRTKSRYNKKHTSTKDVGYGTKKEALTDMGMDNQDFDTLNGIFGGGTLDNDLNVDLMELDLDEL